ncbi:hypothetical protein GTW30_13885 [Streptomyces sp. SID7810]|nr:hypothetical protein [Streptomyces sp. SID7810]
MARHHGFGCAEQMQGQMHVHATEMALPVPLLGHFFCHLPQGPARGPDLSFSGTPRKRPSLSVSVTGRVLHGAF